MRIKKVVLPKNKLAHQVQHGLGTQDILICVWQNGFLVTPSARIIDDNTIEVYDMWEGGNVIVGTTDAPGPPALKADEPAPEVKKTAPKPKTSTRSKTSGTSSSGTKRTRSTSKRASEEGSGA